MAATATGAAGTPTLRQRRLAPTTTLQRATAADDDADVDAISPTTARTLLMQAANGAADPEHSRLPSDPPGPLPPLDPIAVLFHLGLVAAITYGIATTPLRTPTAVWALIYYLICGFSYTAGYHRHYAHKSFQATWPLRLYFTLFGAGNFLGSLLTWCRDHRAHHRNADTPKDPFNRQQGFAYAYLGCRLRRIHQIGEADVRDLEASKLVAVQRRLYPLIAVAFGWVLPAVVANSWNDWQGGLVYAGLLRTGLFLHGQYLLWALGHTYGHQPYSTNHTGRNNTFLSILSLGEGYLNFHREFPGDYRMGCFYYHMDATKWFLRLLSLFRLANGFQKTPYNQILLVRVQKQLSDLETLETKINYGPSLQAIPEWTIEEFEQEVAKGRQLMILDSIAHDVGDFLHDHPGGAEVLLSKIGKDATLAFNGGVQRHSKAARNLAALMRVAVVKGATERRKSLRYKERKASSPKA